MEKMSGRQRRMIFGLAKRQGLDNETLHLYAQKLTGKSSLANLTVREAGAVIDALNDKKADAEGMVTFKQRRYIEGLALETGWADGAGKLDRKRFNAWLNNKFGISDIKWLTSKKASDAIEGLKAMRRRQGKQAGG